MSMSAALSDEADEQAARFLYCANVAQFYYQYSMNHDSASQNVSTFKVTRDNFRMAAAATKAFANAEEFKSANDLALKRVVEILEREKAENKSLIEVESKACAEIMTKEAVPLLSSKAETQK